MKGNRPKIVISGFYGAGNSGDEAMLRNFYFHVRRRLPDAEILVATEKCSGLWHPPDLHYINGMDRAKIKECDLLVVGGGGLGMGFGWNLVSVAKTYTDSQIKAATIGCSYTKEWTFPPIIEAARSVLKLYDMLCVRDLNSLEILRSIYVKAQKGTDIAIDLPEEPIEKNWGDDYVTVTIREVAEHRINDMVMISNKILGYLHKNHNIVLLPCCKEDMLFLNRINAHKAKVVYTDDPQQHKYIINRASAVVSIGRYHPLVYATEQGVPVVGLSWPAGSTKIDHWMSYVGNFEYCLNCDACYADISDESKLKVFQSKFEKAINNRIIYKETMLKTHADHVSLNNKQFDKLVNLIL